MSGDISPYLVKLHAILAADANLPESDRKAFMDIWEPVRFKRKEILTRAGETERYLYFVNEGVQRIYYFDEAEREATIIFTYSPSYSGVVDSFMLQKPSAYYFETLTASEMIRTTYTSLTQITLTNPAIDAMVKKNVTVALSGVLERLVELQCFSSEEKFRRFMQRSPHMLQLVPHKYLADYLGIDATNFSKLINRIKI